jgi:hypothetical protein
MIYHSDNSDASDWISRLEDTTKDDKIIIARTLYSAELTISFSKDRKKSINSAKWKIYVNDTFSKKWKYQKWKNEIFQ